MCEHDYVFLYSDYEKIEGPGLNHYKQLDTFHCRRCLEYKTVTAKEVNDRYKPNWYKG